MTKWECFCLWKGWFLLTQAGLWIEEWSGFPAVWLEEDREYRYCSEFGRLRNHFPGAEIPSFSRKKWGGKECRASGGSGGKWEILGCFPLFRHPGTPCRFPTDQTAVGIEGVSYCYQTTVEICADANSFLTGPSSTLEGLECLHSLKCDSSSVQIRRFRSSRKDLKGEAWSDEAGLSPVQLSM